MKRAVFLFAFLAGVSLHAAPAAKIAVFVGEPDNGSGFVDLADSIRDIKEAIASKKGLRIVRAPEEADVMLTVLERRRESEDIGGIVVPIGPNTMTGRRYANYSILSARIQVADYVRPISSTKSRWRDCARDIASQVHAWIAANRQTLMGRRK